MNSKILNFFSTQANKEKIQTGRLSQTELFIYFYLITLFDYFGLTQQTLDLMGKTPQFIDYLNIWQFRIVVNNRLSITRNVGTFDVPQLCDVG